MAIVEAPFKIKGTIDDINFFMNNEINRARKKAESAMTSEKYWKEPNYHGVRMQGKQMGLCSKTSKIFRLITHAFNSNAKDGSYAGRANALFLNIAKEDHKNVRGSRLVTEGIKTKYGRELLLGFESNKLRPLSLVLPSKKWERNDNSFTIPKCLLETDINWPEEATHVTFNLAIANWNIETNQFTTNYGAPQFFSKTNTKQEITLTVAPPKEEDLHLTFVFIGFSKQLGSKHIPLHRKHNTATLIGYRYFPIHADESPAAPDETPTENVAPPFSFA
jgi:hypothetical protein